MNAADVVYKTAEIPVKAFRGIAKGIKTAFNKVSGIADLHKNGLKFGGGEAFFTAEGAVPGFVAAFHAATMTIPAPTTYAGLAISLAGALGAGLTGAFATSAMAGRLACLHLKGKQRAEEKKQKKAELQLNTPRPAAPSPL